MSIQFPPPSVLTGTEAIIHACEVAEVTVNSTPNFLLVTELAALIHNGEYTSAHHLYQRYQDLVPSSNNNVAPGSSTMDNTKFSTDDLQQFQLLWNAVKPLLHLLSNSRTSEGTSRNTITSSTNTESSNTQTLLFKDATLQFYTNLQSCIRTNQHPLTTYAKELQFSHQCKMLSMMETNYDSILVTTCHALLGAGTDGTDTASVMELIQGRKWEKEGDYYIPADLSTSGTGDVGNVGDTVSGQEKIRFLTKVVSFMEQRRTNA